MSTLKVVIASGQAEWVGECRRLLEEDGRIWAVETAGDGPEAVVMAARAQPDIVLLDLDLILEDDPAFLIGLLRTKTPDGRVLALSSGHPDELVLDSLSAGAMGCLEWADRERLLVKAVRKVSEGEAWVSRRLVTGLLERLAALPAETKSDPVKRNAAG